MLELYGLMAMVWAFVGGYIAGVESDEEAVVALLSAALWPLAALLFIGDYYGRKREKRGQRG